MDGKFYLQCFVQNLMEQEGRTVQWIEYYSDVTIKEALLKRSKISKRDYTYYV